MAAENTGRQSRRSQPRTVVRMNPADLHETRRSLARHGTSLQEFLEACAIAYQLAEPGWQARIARAVMTEPSDSDAAHQAASRLHDLLSGAVYPYTWDSYEYPEASESGDATTPNRDDAE